MTKNILIYIVIANFYQEGVIMKKTSIKIFFLTMFVVTSFTVNTFAFYSPSSSTKNALKQIKILFIGNSFMYVNDMPSMFKKLAASGGYNIYIDKNLPGGYTFQRHADPTDKNGKITLSKIRNNKWNYVILQEQSQYPAYSNLREKMYDGARKLDKEIKKSGGKTVFLMTWGYKNGDSFNSDVEETQTFEGMQEQLQIGYTEIASELSAYLAPAGTAFLNAYESNKNTNLWSSDGKHPDIDGTYLSCCVLYSTIFKKSPVGLKYTANLSKEKATFLQKIAWQTYLNQ